MTFDHVLIVRASAHVQLDERDYLMRKLIADMIRVAYNMKERKKIYIRLEYSMEWKMINALRHFVKM